MSDDISKFLVLIIVTKKVLNTIIINIIISMGINLGAVILAALGIFNPVVGDLVHNVGSVLVVMNSSLLLKYKAK